MIVTVPSETRSVSIQRNGATTMIVLDDDRALIEAEKMGSRSNDIVVSAHNPAPSRTEVFSIRKFLLPHLLYAVAAVVVASLLVHFESNDGKVGGTPTPLAEDRTVVGSVPSSLPREEHQLHPPVPATPPNAAFGLE